MNKFLKLNKDRIIDILENNAEDKILFSYADKVRKENLGETVHLRGLIEFSNICKRQCKYCGLRCQNKQIERYRIESNEIVQSAKNAVNLGYKTIVLQSGEDDYFSTETVIKIIREIKKFDVALTLSIGEREEDEYKEFKKSGANRYLLRIETTDKKLYKEMHPNADFENRLKCLEYLKKYNYEVGTGSLIGLPNQTIESIANDILFFKEIDADMVGIGPFIAHPNTPLKDSPNGDFILALKTMSLTRILLPNINIPATTAMETLKPNGRIIALESGANVVMPNVTPKKYRQNYEIYPGKICTNEEPEKCRKCIESKITSISRTIGTDYGFRKK